MSAVTVLIQFLLQEVAQDEGKLSYTILLILTAGSVEDVKETKQQLIEASNDPLSIVIVGIGDTDFSGMEFLDSFDDAHDAGRDITKFVRFNDYKSYNALTEAVLDEIPDQLVNYYYDRGILPGTDEGYSQEDVEIQPADDDERTFTFLG
jgi:Copine